MTGSAFITFNNGWACSNDVDMEVEKDIDYEAKTSKATTVLKIKGLFTGKGEIFKDNIVSLGFRNENDENLGFNGYVRSITDKKLTIVLTTKHDRVNEILTKIQEEINNGR